MKYSVLFVFVLLTAAFVLSPDNVFSQNRKSSGAKTPVSKSETSTTVATNKAAPTISIPKPAVQNIVEKYNSSAMEQAVLDEINTARREPQKYIQYLEEYKKSFKGLNLYLPNNVWMITKEGVVPVDEAITFMKALPTLTQYNFSNGMNRTTNMHLKDLVENPAVGHFGKDGSDLQTRLGKFGTVSGKYAENIAFYSDTARAIVLSMIIDDNVKSRSHRKNIFSPNFTVVGISFGKATSGESFCVVNFADGFSDLGSKPVAREF